VQTRVLIAAVRAAEEAAIDAQLVRNMA